MRDAAIIGVGISEWKESHNKSIEELFLDAAFKAVNESKVERIDSICVSNRKLIGSLEEIRTAFAFKFGINPRSIKTRCFSPLLAFKEAYSEVISGLSDIVIVGGVEKHPTLCNLLKYPKKLAIYFAKMAKIYMEKYRAPRRHISMVAVKNHENGCRNTKARFQIKITPEAVENSNIVADPLRELDCSVASDGAAAIVLCPLNMAKSLSKYNPVKISGIGLGYNKTKNEHDLTNLYSSEEAAYKAYKMADIKSRDISLAEVHDNFTISELVILESLCLFEKGSAGKATENGITRIEGRLPINPSGGLKSKGNATSATLIAQLVELTSQLRQTAGPNQVKLTHRGLAHNMTPYGDSAFVTILEAI